MQGQSSAAKADSWFDDEDMEESDDFDEQEMDMDSEDDSEDSRAVIPPRRRSVRVRLDEQGRQVHIRLAARRVSRVSNSSKWPLLHR